jgi:hypothetical protein
MSGPESSRTPLRLRTGTSIESALDDLRLLKTEADNVRGAGPSDSGVQLAYDQWVENCELRLAGLSRDPQLVLRFQTERYWRVRASRVRPRVVIAL